MRKILITSTFILFCYAAQSQVIMALLVGNKLNSGNLAFRLAIGPGFNNLSGDNSATTSTSLDFGLFLSIKLSDKLFIVPEAYPKYSNGAEIPLY